MPSRKESEVITVIWIILSAAAVLVILMLIFVFALLKAAARYEEEYPHLTDYKSEWEEIKEEKSDVKKI